MQDVQKKIASILIEKLGIPESEITPDASFVKDLGIDSLDYAELVMEFEQVFDIKIPDDDAEKMQTIGDAVNYIKSKLKA
jgi:acyl carrier protein